MTEIKEQLTQEIDQIEWKDLQPHARRDAVILVDSSLDLVEVGVAIAQDQIDLVQNWISRALLKKPSLEQLSDWNQNPEFKLTALIVQPFVLVSL